MLTVFDPAYHRSERTVLGGQTFGSVRIAQKDQKSIRINPTPRRSLARDLRGPPLRSFARPKLLERASVYAGVQAYPLFTMSRNPPRSFADGIGALSMDAILRSGGANRDRTDDPVLTKDVLYRLSYSSACVIRRKRHFRSK